MVSRTSVHSELWPDDPWRRVIHGVGAAVGTGTIVALTFQFFGQGPSPVEDLMAFVGSLGLLGGIALAGAVPHVLGSLAMRAAHQPAWVGGGWMLACVGDLGSRAYILGGFMDDPLALIGLITFPIGWAVFVVGGLAAEYGLRWRRAPKNAVSKGRAGAVGGAALVGAIGIGAQLVGWATLSLLLWCVAVAGGGLGALAGGSTSP